MPNQRSRRFLVALMLIAIALVAVLASPFASSLFAASVLATALYPVQTRLARRMGKRPHVAAAILTLGIVLSVVVPLAVTSAFAVREAQAAARWFDETIHSKGVDGIVEPLPPAFRSPAKSLLAALPASWMQDAGSPTSEPPAGEEPAKASSPAATRSSVSGAAGTAVKVASKIASIVAQFGVCALAIFFLLLEGAKLITYIVGITPLAPQRTRQLLTAFRDVSVSVLLSVLATAASQTIVAGVGYLIASVPSFPLILLVTAVCSFIPAIGGSSVTICVGAFVWASGRPGMGIFLIVWGILAVGLVDNAVKPWVAKRGTNLPGSIVFFAMICGIAVFGPMGLVAGPLILALFQVVARMLGAQRETAAVEAHS